MTPSDLLNVVNAVGTGLTLEDLTSFRAEVHMAIGDPNYPTPCKYRDQGGECIESSGAWDGFCSYECRERYFADLGGGVVRPKPRTIGELPPVDRDAPHP